MAYDFNGTTDYFSRLTAPVTAVPLTMSCWFNLDNITAVHALMAIGVQAGNNGRFVLFARGDVAGDPVQATTTSGATQGSANSTLGYSANTWTHGAAVFAAANSRFGVINGVAGLAETTSVTPAAVTQTTVGARINTTPGAFTDGRIADAAIWNVALTSPELLALAAGVSPRLIRPSALIFYMPLVRTPVDLRGALMTTIGTPAVAVHPRIINTRGPRNFRFGSTAAPAPVINQHIYPDFVPGQGVGRLKNRG